jgi:plastocyanin
LIRAVVRLVAVTAILAGGIAALAVFTRAAPASAAASARPAGDGYTGTTVAMKDNDYLPQTLTVDAGAEVRWVNEGRSNHNVIPDRDATGWKSPSIKPGKTFTQKLEAPGVYPYFCSFHGAPGKGMYGTLIVKNPEGTLPTAALKREARAGTSGKPRTIRVPQDVKRIQAAVDRAPQGSLILVSPGVYREAVTVTTDRLVIRGLDRNRVILDGGYTLDNGVMVLGANGVAVENMTARRYTKNGFFWTGARGYRGSYLTATRNGDYGIYAFDAVDGLLDHDYGSGSPDAGFYVGQCFPCNTLITRSIAEYNGLGFSGTNAGGNLVIARSVWRYNRAGIVPNSGDGEKNPPQHGATIVGNLVHDNDNLRTPAIDAAILAQNNGILVAGGNENLITRNRVYSHGLSGIGVVPNPDTTVWLGNDNRIVDNVVSNSGEADLAAFGGTGNCFADNRFTTSKPSNIEAVLPCAGTAAPKTDELDISKYLSSGDSPSVDYRKAKTPKPPRLSGMKNAASAKARPAVRIVVAVNVDAVRTPRAPRTATP